jgi:type I restriction enzyme, S subunit
VSKKLKIQKSIEALLEEVLVPEEEQPYDLPGNWTWVRLGGAFAECLDKLRKPVSATERAKRPGNVPYYGATGQAGWIDDYLTNEELILVGEDGAPFLDPYKKKAYMINGKAWVNNHAHILKSKFGSASNVYLLHYLNQFNYYGYVSGTTRLKLNQKNLNLIPVPLPPLEEQKRIAEKVEYLLNKIDEAKRLIDEAKETFELRRSAILDKAFRGDLTAKWREENPNVESANDRYECIKRERFAITESQREHSDITKMFDEFDFKTGKDEKNWLFLKANMFCYNINCGGTPTKDISENGDVPFLKVYNIVNNKMAFTYKAQYIPKYVHDTKLKKSKLQPRDVIMNIVGPPLKKFAIIPEQYPEMNMNQAIVRFRPIKYVLPEYLYYCLQYDETLKDVMNETRGVVGQSNISISQSRNLIMPIPSIEEQAEIVKKVEFLLKREDKAYEYISDSTNLDNLEQSILSRAFLGELGTNDPTEGSAIELLIEVLQEQVK